MSTRTSKLVDSPGARDSSAAAAAPSRRAPSTGSAVARASPLRLSILPPTTSRTCSRSSGWRPQLVSRPATWNGSSGLAGARGARVVTSTSTGVSSEPIGHGSGAAAGLGMGVEFEMGVDCGAGVELRAGVGPVSTAQAARDAPATPGAARTSSTPSTVNRLSTVNRPSTVDGLSTVNRPSAAPGRRRERVAPCCDHTVSRLPLSVGAVRLTRGRPEIRRSPRAGPAPSPAAVARRRRPGARPARPAAPRPPR